MGPRDQPVRFSVPVDFETGEEISPRQMHHLTALAEAADALYSAMHDAEGSTRGDYGFQSRRMSIAGTHLETALMFARKAALEVK
ncbi:hypothetical protein [Mesorhizobium sp.]|uniref:hypothetical protein n=1 Tax=Mesorhizobium sp. TaxID=1871066 RepID=UPI000FE95C42|nr:hypothetical protein [Mesorhizobium sp.]RWP05093.1 MAG: hypothetical protein EOQ99_16620 [Mesorhizobium sp.]